MEYHKPNSELPPIPAKRYFTIGEVSELCGVKAHVLRYWEQEFTQLNPVKRSGNRRYYQHHEVVLIRRIRELLYEQGFTISGARNRLENARSQGAQTQTAIPVVEDMFEEKVELGMGEWRNEDSADGEGRVDQAGRNIELVPNPPMVTGLDVVALKREIRDIIALLDA